MSNTCEVHVCFMQEDEDLGKLKEGVQKIEEFYSGVWGWDWNPDIDLDDLDEYDAYYVWTNCKDRVGRIFEDKNQKLAEMMSEYGIASQWKGITDYPISGSYIETNFDGTINEEMYFNLESAIYDEDGEPIAYTAEDFDLFMGNIKKCLDAKELFDMDNNLDYWRELFDENYEDSDNLHEALAEANNQGFAVSWGMD